MSKKLILVADPISEKGIELLKAEPSFDVVVNLAGENIAEGRWTEERKTALRSSRIDSTRSLVKAMAAIKRIKCPGKTGRTQPMNPATNRQLVTNQATPFPTLVFWKKSHMREF